MRTLTVDGTSRAQSSQTASHILWRFETARITAPEAKDILEMMGLVWAVKPKIPPRFLHGACTKGHPWTVESTRVRPDGSRRCKICARNTNRATRVVVSDGVPRRQTARDGFPRKCYKRIHDLVSEADVMPRGGCRACRNANTARKNAKARGKVA